MPGYLLLRNNKESGPHTLEEIIAMQLKQHDLIWVEGRSAAWRYPEELEEFRKYVTGAPIENESRKPTSISEIYQQQPAIKKPAVSQQAPYVEASNIPKTEPANQRDREAKYISVIFPNTVKPAIEKKQPDTPSVAAEKTPPVIKKEKIIVEDEVAPSFSSGSFSAKFPERTVQLAPKEDKGFNAAKNIIWGVAILLGGVVLGLSLDKIITSKPASLPVDEPVAKQTVVPAAHDQEPAASTSSTENSTAFVTNTPEPEKQAEKPLKKKAVDKAALIPVVETESSKKTDSAPDNSAAATSIPVKIDAATEEKEKAKANIRNLLSVTNNKFKLGAFGGINELQISVTNNSNYPVDVVAVDVHYLLVNKKVFKTETIYFRDLHPGVTLMQEAPKSSRGVTIEYSINTVNSKALGL
jgi:hypothetical protein